ncbi:MAG: hypothetical protein QGG48_02630 [Desulfatiglandales bacterium]|jgi:hypothetical protein|nr:hypothetical protein [Desulfatiglandales bacterium]
MPRVLIDEPSDTYWSRWLKFFEKELLAQGYINTTDFNLFGRGDSVNDAVKKIDSFYFYYHSMRYVEERLVIRLTSIIDQQKVRDSRPVVSIY